METQPVTTFAPRLFISAFSEVSIRVYTRGLFVIWILVGEKNKSQKRSFHGFRDAGEKSNMASGMGFVCTKQSSKTDSTLTMKMLHFVSRRRVDGAGWSELSVVNWSQLGIINAMANEWRENAQRFCCFRILAPNRRKSLHSSRRWQPRLHFLPQ